MADALTYLHGLSPKIIFRDLSAANVMLTSAKLDRADVKLIDFGLAKLAPQRIAPTSLHADGESQDESNKGWLCLGWSSNLQNCQDTVEEEFSGQDKVDSCLAYALTFKGVTAKANFYNSRVSTVQRP